MDPNTRKYVFIINPSSGRQKLREWDKLIAANLLSGQYEILYTRYPGHSNSLLANLQPDENECIVAVGGDGTVSELIQKVLQSKAYLGIIPTGSGNGLARHLGIPMAVEKAIRQLTTATPRAIDLFKVNGQYCCNTCGIGFTALVTKNFGLKGQRGFRTYFKLALALYKDSETFDLNLNQVTYTNIWMLEFANSSQLGNDAIVSPTASVQDGIVDILIVQKPKSWQIPSFIVKSITGKILQSRLSRLIKVTEVRLRLPKAQHYHIDGEYKGLIDAVDLDVLPSAIQIIH